MLSKFIDNIFGRNLKPQERMLRIALLIGGVLSLFGMIECAILVDASEVFVPLGVLIIAMAGSIYAMFKRKSVGFATVVVGIVVVALIFPCMFFMSGGINGGVPVWFVLSLFYVFMMFSGKRLAFFLILSFGVDLWTYVTAYQHPEYVVALPNERAVYLDSIFSVLAVGLAVGVIFKFQVQLYEKERRITNAQKEELERIGNSKNEFFANMSHEIRTPINTIIGLNEMILRENPTGETREYAQNIQNASSLLLNLVNDILDLSQVESKRMEIMPMEYHTKELFENLVDMTQVRMKEKKLNFLVDIDQSLPSVLMGDEIRLKQVLLNILSNAAKYTNEGSVTLSASGEIIRSGDLLLKVSVADTGIGIRKEDLEHLYEAFERVDKKKNVGIEGSGLGLAISKQLMDLMGGEITVDSIYTKGSTFTISLKQRIIDATPLGRVQFLEKENEAVEVYYQQSFEAPEARVLIVDDNEISAMVTSRLLKETKMQVDVVNSGAECLKKTKEKYYHVILMDYMMPKMNGVETLKELRHQENGLCRESSVIILTANVLNGARQLCYDNGFDGYLEKPIEAMKLEAGILSFLPEELVEYRMNTLEEVERKRQIQQISQRKKKKIYITTDCVCDLPEELLDRYEIKMMHLYIKTEKGRFADVREIDSDNLAQILMEEESYVRSDGVTVEEYQEFFADMLTRAEDVIHISMAAHVGSVYQVAKQAARGFGHVHVIDSGQISGGQGLVALYAAKMVLEGKNVLEICEAVERSKGRIESTFLMSTSKSLYQNRYTDVTSAKMCDTLNVRPVLTMKQSKLIIIGTRKGKMENAWKRCIRYHLRHRRKIDPEAVVITHVGCSVKQQDMIKEEVLKCMPFKKVYIHKASVSCACNAGLESIGIAYYTKSLK